MHKILILIDKFYRYGGGEIWLEDILNNKSQNLDFKCIVSIEDIPEDLYQSYPIPVYKFSEDLAKKLSNDCDFLIFWGRVLDYPKFFNVIARILIAHSDYNTKWFLEKSENYADYSIACSTNVKNKINLKNCSVIWPGIDESRYDLKKINRTQIKELLGFEKDDFVIGQFCRFAKFKNIEFTVDFIAETKELKLLLIGHGETMFDIINLCEKKISKRFQYLYYSDTKNISNFYSAIDLFCLPSLGEGYARVQWESMMFEVPFAGFNVGGVGDGIIHEENGFIIENKKDLLKVTEKLKDKKYYKKITNNAKDYFEKNGKIKNNIEKIESFLTFIKKKQIKL